MAFRSSTQRPRSGGGGYRRGTRRNTDWARGVFAPTLAAGVKFLIGSFTLANPGIAETVRRTIISWSATPSGFALPLAFGMIVVTDQALSTGITALPGPVTDASDDGWFIWQSVMMGGAGLPRNTREIDSRAMRRIEDGFSVAIMGENTGAASATLGLGISLLASRS